ncbi:hypothetical protein ACHHYP_16553 [Achlya hypogyna]|uniref:DNA polymerase delta subunit 3 n=1 Tax=Achlya hypogyna TaxID=1202772 RepID=A0A1V9ZE33_ACHHY|nr:hypothetical protein ACHHYP_16553 [Achlya hypogyna]
MAEVVQDMLDRAQVPSVVGVSRVANCSLDESRSALETAMGSEGAAGIYVAVDTVTDSTTKAVVAKTISLSLIAGGSLYAVYSAATASTTLDDGLKTALWFPAIADGVASATFGSASSDITCAAATYRQGRTQKGAESASVFHDFKKPTVSTSSSSSSSSSLFAKTKPSPKPAAKPAAKSSFFGKSKATTTPVPPAKKSHVIESDESENSDDEMPKFVKKTTQNKRLKVCDSSDDDDDPLPKTTTPKAAAPKLKAATPPRAIPAEQPDSPPPAPEVPKRAAAPAAPPAKRQRLVTKTRITDEGYMVNETVYEDIDEEEEQPAPKPAARPAPKLPAPPPKKKRVVKSSGSAKQASMMDFFGKK